jgi:shikimate kinase
MNFNITKLALPAVILIGPPGAGKSTVGDLLAKELDWIFWDTDVLIQEASGMNVRGIFSRHGEKAFRDLETKLVTEMLLLYNRSEEMEYGTVISTGGGLPIRPENLESLKKIGNIINLYASIDVLLDRIGQVENRPLLDAANFDQQQSSLELLMETRKKIYEQADFSIDTSNLSVDAVVECIKSKLSFNRQKV